MSDEHRFERDARAWLELGPTDAPDRVVEAALLEIDQTSQERDLWIPWRLPTMNSPMRLAAAALVGVVALGLIYLNLPGKNDVGPPSPTSTLPTATSTPRATAADYTTLDGWIVFEHFGKAPDGSTPAGVEYPRSLWLVHADGTGLHELAPGIPASGKGSPDISPDGNRVAFSAWDLPVQIWEVDIEGGDPRLLSTDCSGQPADCTDNAPAYSADGSRIVFVRSTGTDQSNAIAILDLASGSVTTLESTRTSSPDVWLAEPSWSPDGLQIVYHDVRRDPAQDAIVDASIFIVNADGSGLHELALPDGTPFGDADWSPDGSQIVFSSYPIHEFNDSRAAVSTVRPDGTDLQTLTSSNIGYGAPSWTPDGLHIMFWGPTTFYLMDPDGANLRPINKPDLTFFGDTLGFGYYGYLQPTS